MDCLPLVLMKHLLTLSLCLLLFSVYVAGQDLIPQIKNAAIRYGGAFQLQDIAMTVSMMDSDYLQSIGGQDSVTRSLRNDFKAFLTQQTAVKSVTVFNPAPIAKLGRKLYSVVPDSIVYSTMGAGWYLKSSLIASSLDSGKTWKFTPGTSFRWLKKAFPATAVLDVPPSSQQFLESNPNQASNSRDTLPKNGGTYPLKMVGRRALALIVIPHNEEFVADATSIKIVKEKWKKTTLEGMFIPEPENAGKYGPDAANGVIRFVIDDKKYPQAYDKIKAKLKYAGPADIERLKTVFGLQD